MTILTKENFRKEVLDSKVPVIVDFWASWCGPCRMLAPVLEEVEATLGENVKVCKVNVDEQMDLATQYKVDVIPTLFFFKDGKQQKKTVGVVDKNQLVSVLVNL